MDVMTALRYVVEVIKNWTDENKVQKVSGKGLSSNDYTAEDKEKVKNIANGLLFKNNELYLSKDGEPIYNGVYLPTGSGDGVSVQADWEQNDEAALDYIKNRPFSSGDLIETEVYDVNAIVAGTDGDWAKEREETVDGINYLYSAYFDGTLKGNKEYSIVINGDKYVDIAVCKSNIVFLGDLDAYFHIFNNNSEDFNYLVLNFFGSINVFYKGIEPPADFKIYEREQEIVKIEPKYLPGGGVGYIDSEFENKTYDIIKIINESIGSDIQITPPEESYTGKETIDGWAGFLKPPFNFVVGNEYEVSVNNVSYTSIAKIENIEGVEAVCIGDVDEFMTEDWTNFKFVATLASFGAYYLFEIVLDAEYFGLTDIPTELTITGLSEIETIHKIDSKFLPKLHSQSNWNENGQDADCYIQNRPFYEDYVPDEVLLEEQTLDSPVYSPSNPLLLIEGEVYIVTLNGKQYKCVAWTDEIMDLNFNTSCVAIGNPSIFGYDNHYGKNEPFLVFTSIAEEYAAIIVNEINSTIKIESTVPSIKKLDSKYLPDAGIGYTETKLEDKTFDIIQIMNDSEDKGYNVSYDYMSAEDTQYGFPVVNIDIWSSEKLPCNLVAGNNYNIVINGESYTSKAKQLTPESVGFTDSYRITNGDANFKYAVSYSTLEDMEALFITLNAEHFGLTDIPSELTIIGPSLDSVETEVIHKIDPKFLPDDIGAIKSVNGSYPDDNGNINITPDWNQNDDTAPDYIKNRPFYDDLTETEMLPEETFTITEDYYVQISDSLTFIEGETYRIVFNGEAYECVAWAYDDTVSIGNGSLINASDRGDNVPFACTSLSNGECYLDVTEHGDYTVKITALEGNVVKIDEKYLPELFSGSWNDLTDKPSGSWNELKDKPFEYEEKFEWGSEVEYEEIITDEEYGYSMIKISSNIPSDKEKFVGGRAYAENDGEYFEVVMNESYIESFPDSDDVYYVAQNFMVVESDETSLDGLTITKGVWFFPYTDEPYTKIGIATALKKIDPSVLHDPYYYEKGELIFSDKISLYESSNIWHGSIDFEPKPNKTYVIELNGIEYLCETKKESIYGYVLGNVNIPFVYNDTIMDVPELTEEEKEKFVSWMLLLAGIVDTGEPFCIAGGDFYVTNSFSNNIKIYESKVNKIKPEYIPSSFIQTKDIFNAIEEEPHFKWSENTVYSESVAIREYDTSENEDFLKLVKISSDPPQPEFFINKILIATSNYATESIPIVNMMIDIQDGYYTIMGLFIVVTEDGAEVYGTALTPGVWVKYDPDKSKGDYLIELAVVDDYKIINQEMIPGNIARVCNTVRTPLTAQVGQTIVVKTIDENGKPTDWECVNIPTLPPVTAEDNGKVLTVVDGVWALV